MKILGARKAIQDALAYAYTADSSMYEYLTYLCRVDKTRKTGMEQHVMAIQYAKIRAAINDQKAPIPQWINFAYGPDLEVSNKPSQKRALSRMLALQLINGHISEKKRDRLERLCGCAVEDYRVGMFLGKTLPQVVYAELMNVRDDHWQRDWEPYRQKALDIIKRLDSDGIGRVSIVVRDIRESERETA